jgi:hypothetical protein
MYLLARLFLIIGYLAVWVAAVEFILLAWPFSVLVVLGVVVRRVRRRRALTTLGSARWASERDLHDMLQGDSGLILGRLMSDEEA